MASKGADNKHGQLSLSWGDLSYSIPHKESKDGRRQILQPQSGRALPGDLVALMGPSGSGKTSLLNALAGRLPLQKGAVFEGRVEVSGVLKADLPCHFADLSAYVEQEDCLYALSTVMETMDFAARLRLPKETPQAERERRIDEVLRQLGLAHVRDTNVGGTSFNGALRGLSGGERKRLSIGIELLHSPSILFLDEPTTGLDSYQALNAMQKLQGLAEEGRTVIVSIHQPRSQIFALFTSLCVLSRGAPVYSGSAEKATDYFASLGHSLPPRFNPADFMIDLVSVDQLSPEAQQETEARVESLHKSWSEHAAAAEKASPPDDEPCMASILDALPKSTPAGHGSFVTPFVLLLRRGWREQMRDKFAVLFKTIFQMILTGVFGLVYFQLGYKQVNIQDRAMLLTFLSMNIAFGASIGTAQIIPRQLSIVNRERANRLYAITPFYITAVAVSMPPELVPQVLANVIMFFMANLSGSFWIFSLALALENMVFVSVGMCLSALLPSVTMAPQIAPAVVIIFLIFNGNFINVDSVPVYFKWLSEISPIKYTFQALAVNEFEDAKFECGSSDVVCIETGEQVLSQLKFTEEDLILKSCVALVILTVAFNIIAWGILIARKPKFLQPVPAKTAGPI
jgi:ABC-type multidrug transport system ATPase subunit/ABC-type multidrug transport system permease subunit